MFDQNQIDRIDSISNGYIDSLIKGQAIDAFEYNSTMKIVKDGKFVKERLSKYKSSCENDHTSCHTEMATCLAIIPKEIRPTTEPSSYTFEGIRKSAFGNYPKMFSYEQKKPYYKSSNESSKYPTMNSIHDSAIADPGRVVLDAMERYNEKARKCIRGMADCLWLDTLIESIDDKQKIELTGRMLKLLV